MLFSRGFSRIGRNSFNGLCRCLLSRRMDAHQLFVSSIYSQSLNESTQKVIWVHKALDLLFKCYIYFTALISVC